MLVLAMSVLSKSVLFMAVVTITAIVGMFALLCYCKQPSTRAKAVPLISMTAIVLLLAFQWASSPVYDGNYGIQKDRVLRPGLYLFGTSSISVPEQASGSFPVLEGQVLQVSYQVKNPDDLKNLYEDLQPHRTWLYQPLQMWLKASLTGESESVIAEKAQVTLKRLGECGIEADITLNRKVETFRFSNRSS